MMQEVEVLKTIQGADLLIFFRRTVYTIDGPNRFDFTLKNHYHVRCVKCGDVSDVDMDEIPDLLKRIHDTHGIEYLDYDISFKGICRRISGKK